jgi:1-acyl-sn-glycerol-3-phosphate acyltransferase
MVVYNMFKEIRMCLGGAAIFSYIITAPLIPKMVKQIYQYYLVSYVRFLCNVKINVYGNKTLLNDNDIYMANHYEGVDYPVLYPLITSPFSNACYSIAKDDALGKQYPIMKIKNVLEYFIKLFYESGDLIPYTRGDKNSGARVRDKAVEILNNNNKILIFPEGRSWRKGACHEFKPGMFEVAEQCNKSIVPITLKYRNFDGKNKGEKCVIQDWMDIEVDIFIHDKVSPKNHMKMLEETFEKITSKN